MTTRYRAQAALPTCPEHPDESLDTYCTICNKRVCEACRDYHKDHKWTRVNRLARMVRQNAETRCQDITDMLTQMKKVKTASSGQKQIEAIRRMQRKLVTMVNDYADTMVSMVKSGADDASMSEEIQKLELMLDFLQNQLDTADENVIMEIEEEFYKKREILSSVEAPGREMKFEEGKVSSDVLYHMFGRVIKKDLSDQGDKTEVWEISHFTHVDDSTSIYSIRSGSHDEAWINRQNMRQIDKADHKGIVIHERKVPTAVDDFSLIDNNDIMYTLSSQKIIRIVSSSGTVRDVCSTDPLRPKGICRSRDGGVLVCLVDGKSSDITPESRGEIHLIDTSGKILEKYSNTEDKKNKLFICPKRISQNINMDFCVVDAMDKEHRARLVVVSTTSMIRFIYSGQPALKKRFSSNDVACDDPGRIMVTDLHNHAVHLLREDGHFLQYILTKQSPLYGPRCLCLHGDTLWVGCEKGLIRVYKFIDADY